MKNFDEEDRDFEKAMKAGKLTLLALLMIGIFILVLVSFDKVEIRDGKFYMNYSENSKEENPGHNHSYHPDQSNHNHNHDDEGHSHNKDNTENKIDEVKVKVKVDFK